jgi:hypothetical protein
MAVVLDTELSMPGCCAPAGRGRQAKGSNGSAAAPARRCLRFMAGCLTG